MLSDQTVDQKGPAPERILIVHARYRQPGGEEAVVAAEAALLRSRGHLVDEHWFDNAAWARSSSVSARLRQGAETVWSEHARRTLQARIRASHPDLVHVHNTYPSASPSVYSVAARAGIPVVQSLHNYRLMCPAATFYRDGHTCTDCLGRSVPWPGVFHACYSDSRAASAITALMLTLHNARGTWDREIDHFICETDFARDLFVAGGVAPDRISVKPNFLEPDPADGADLGDGRSGLLFVGRLAEEKGIATLLAAARSLPGIIRVVGTGPLEADVAAAARAGIVHAAGFLPGSELQQAMRNAGALLLPSHSFEGFPITVLEAFANGLPVIASALGGLPSIVEDRVTGLLFPPHEADALADRMRWAVNNPAELRRMGDRARQRYLSRFRGDRNYDMLVAIYALAMARARAREGVRAAKLT